MKSILIALIITALALCGHAAALQNTKEGLIPIPFKGINETIYNKLVFYAKYCAAAYGSRCPKPMGNTLVEQVRDDATGADGMIVRDDRKKEIVVAFRGTSELTDVITDILILLAPLQSPGLGDVGEARVHTGFLASYNSIASDVLRIVEKQLEAHPSYSVVVTGHSLGGALAPLGAISIRAAYPKVPMKLFTYGQPRVGNSAFADYVEAAIGAENIYRAVHAWDGVVTLPPRLIGYEHYFSLYDSSVSRKGRYHLQWQHTLDRDQSASYYVLRAKFVRPQKMSTSEAPNTVDVVNSPEELRTIVQQGYDECAPKYTTWQSSRGIPESVSDNLSRLFAHLKPESSVLELGCGPGVPCTKLLVENELNLTVTAVDISASQICHARELVQSPRVEFVHSDMTKLDYPEATFDAVVAFYSFFHLPKVDQGPMVRKIAKWLKPGGVLLMNMKNEEGDDIVEKWMGVRMFSTGLGVEGNLKMIEEYGEGLDVEAKVIGEKMGLSMQVFFHWIWAVKK
ncbi:hypothetical protein NP233_g4674 [Leucocoprinus birnbaumii]|uniref:Triacylglycerol lipase n=1 Tax=Leucocoprinus birnbaumii TaxID=56174 RepID=A0AAD5W0P2_9AGAR|nr:hypothetical protein NP233_g4674 [Leucocoprinus birnbaumii]